MKFTAKCLAVMVLLFAAAPIQAQVSKQKVGTNPTTINQSAVLEIESVKGGLLPPRMTQTQMNAITNPVQGLMVYCLDCSPTGLRHYTGAEWADLTTMFIVSRPVNTAVPVISGTYIKQNSPQTLTTSNGVWSGTNPITYTYQWQRATNGSSTYSNITGATANSYVIPSSDANAGTYSYQAVVTATNSFGAASATTSPLYPSTTSTDIATNTALPVVSGIAYFGHQVTSTQGTWTSATNQQTYAYQWYSNGSAITGATGSAYTVTYDTEGTPLTCTVTARTGAGTSSATSDPYRNWVPTDYSTTASLWLDSSDPRSYTVSSGAVSVWRDKSGNNFNFSQPTASLRPKVVSNRITFDGTDDFLQGTTWAATDFSAGGTVGFNATMNASGGFVRIYDFGNVPATNALGDQFVTARQTGSYTMYTSNSVAPTSAGNFSLMNSPSATDGVNASYSMTIAGGTPGTKSSTLSYYYKDGVAGTGVSMFVPTNVARANTLLGKSNYARDTAYLSGNISELVVYPSAMTDAIRYKLEGYLAWKWDTQTNLPSGHAYSATPPLP